LHFGSRLHLSGECNSLRLPPKLPGSDDVVVTPLDIGEISQVTSDLDNADPQKPGDKGLSDES
tara:strand:+ start:403 stop:591 length:189 start_codon:yes stop_codon:yes gene_type:complete